MKIGLIDVDSHNFPNLALMKISAHHKADGDSVEWWNGLKQYDHVYVSRIFDDTYSTWENPVINASTIHYGGTGFCLSNWLPENIESEYPDYSLYPNYHEAYGFLTRGCPRNCPFCVVGIKEGMTSHHVADLSNFWRGQEKIKLLDPNLLACRDHERLLTQLAASGVQVDFTQGLDARLLTRDNITLLKTIKMKRLHFAWDQEKDSKSVLEGLQKLVTCGIKAWRIVVYVLTNFNTSFEFDLERVYTLRSMGIDPYIMIYNKPKAPQRLKDLQGWVNNRIIWSQCEKFEEYNRKSRAHK